MEALQRLHMGGHPMPFGLHHPDQAMMRANIGDERKSPMNLDTMSSTIINMVSQQDNDEHALCRELFYDDVSMVTVKIPMLYQP